MRDDEDGASPELPRAAPLPAWLAPATPLWIGLGVAAGVTLAALPPLGLALGVAGAAVGVARWLGRRRWRGDVARSRERVEVRDGQLLVGGRVALSLDEISEGALVPHAHGATVVLRRRGLRPPLHLDVASVDDGRALLAACGAGVEARAMTRKVASQMFTKRGYLVGVGPLVAAIPAAIGLAALGLEAAIPVAVTASVAWALLSFYTLGLVKTRVTVGSDGVRIRWLGRERAIPIAAIEQVDARSRGTFGARTITLHLDTGERVPLLVGVRGNNLFEPFDADEERAKIAERIEHARRLGGEVRELGEMAIDAWVDRRDALDVTELIRDLRLRARVRAKTEGVEVVRALLAMVEASAAPAALRVAAAAALGDTLDAPARERLRVVARASAVPEVRVALEAAADGEDAPLADALASLAREHRVRVHAALDEELQAEAEHEVEALLDAPGEGYRTRGR
ncbi:MAG: PH domain-containing protein [Sandaracinaceae bacterium]|nr:PH domain-containing protein [Sandaracinaceae bacterium]